jgi:GNAT superfamily N-acetyltransferase
VSVRVDHLDPSSEADLRDGARIQTAYWREVLGPDEPEFPPEELRDTMLRVHRDDIDATGLLARDPDRDDEVVGMALVDIRHGHGNEHMAWLPDLYVLPAERRRKIGTALLHEVIALSEKAGRTLVIGGHPEGHEAGLAFAAAAGAVAGNAERQNRLATADIDRAAMQGWVDRAAERASGYSLVAFDNRCPDELLDDLVRMKAVMNTAPRPESLDEYVFTAEQRRAADAEHEAAGDTQWWVCARHDASGALVAYTEIVFAPHRPWLAQQGDTAVDPAHRNKGLGRWLKATTALRLLDERPEVRVIETWNDGTNAPMLGINTAMGFRSVATWRDQELTLG